MPVIGWSHDLRICVLLRLLFELSVIDENRTQAHFKSEKASLQHI